MIQKPAIPDPGTTAGLHDDGLDIGALLPDTLAAWRPLLVEAIGFFLEHLPAPRLDAIVAEQFALDGEASPAARAAGLLAHCPTLHKLGQVVARQPALHPELRRQLQALESMPPSIDMDALLRQIRAQLGPRSALRLADSALAEGSVAVVLPCSWRQDGRVHEGVLKVLKPGIAGHLAEELAILPALATFLEHRAAALGLPAIDYRSHLASASRLLQQEIRLDREQANMRAASALLDADGAVFVPALLPWCTPEITAMARVEGPKLADAVLRPGQGRRLGHALVAALLGRPFWSAADDALFHGDLHGGNLLLAPDGRIAALDWSLTASLSKPHREALVAIALAALALDEARVVAGLAALGLRDARGAAITARVGAALDALVRSGRPPGFDWLLRLLDELALQGAAGFGAQLAVLRKSWLSLSGVLHDLGAGAQADLPLIDVGLQRFMGEWPARLVAAPDSRAFATHVSTADLIHTAVHAWPASLRYWTRLFARA